MAEDISDERSLCYVSEFDSSEILKEEDGEELCEDMETNEDSDYDNESEETCSEIMEGMGEKSDSVTVRETVNVSKKNNKRKCTTQGKNKSYQCAECGKTFKYLCYLRNHQQSHLG